MSQLRNRVRAAGLRCTQFPRSRGLRCGDPAVDGQGGAHPGLSGRHGARRSGLPVQPGLRPADPALPVADHHQRQPGGHRAAQRRAAGSTAAWSRLARHRHRGGVAGGPGIHHRPPRHRHRHPRAALGAARRRAGDPDRRDRPGPPARLPRGRTRGPDRRGAVRNHGRRRPGDRRARPLPTGRIAHRPRRADRRRRRDRRVLPVHRGAAARFGERGGRRPGGRRDGDPGHPGRPVVRRHRPPRFDWLVVVAFCTAVAGAVAVAGMVEQAG